MGDGAALSIGKAFKGLQVLNQGGEVMVWGR